jgi:arginase
MRERIALIDAPSSAGAYSPGQEKAPRALRRAGLVERLREPGIEVEECGSAGAFRWRPDREQPRAQNLGAAVEAASTVRTLVAGAAADAFTLVLGGDCTVGIGTVAGQLAAAERLALVYFDLHADLNVPASVVDGALDWMGVAHMLGLDGATPELAGIGERRPLLESDQILFFGVDFDHVTEWEREAIEARSLAAITVAEVTSGPCAAAERAREIIEPRCDRLAVHFDVDVIDFLDAPLAENVERQGGLGFEQAKQALAVLLDSPKAVALTVTEVNPDHGAEDGSTISDLADALAQALAPRQG